MVRLFSNVILPNQMQHGTDGHSSNVASRHQQCKPCMRCKDLDSLRMQLAGGGEAPGVAAPPADTAKTIIKVEDHYAWQSMMQSVQRILKSMSDLTLKQERKGPGGGGGGGTGCTSLAKVSLASSVNKSWGSFTPSTSSRPLQHCKILCNQSEQLQRCQGSR